MVIMEPADQCHKLGDNSESNIRKLSLQVMRGSPLVNVGQSALEQMFCASKGCVNLTHAIGGRVHMKRYETRTF